MGNTTQSVLKSMIVARAVQPTWFMYNYTAMLHNFIFSRGLIWFAALLSCLYPGNGFSVCSWEPLLQKVTGAELPWQCLINLSIYTTQWILLHSSSLRSSRQRITQTASLLIRCMHCRAWLASLYHMTITVQSLCIEIKKDKVKSLLQKHLFGNLVKVVCTCSCTIFIGRLFSVCLQLGNDYYKQVQGIAHGAKLPTLLCGWVVIVRLW